MRRKKKYLNGGGKKEKCCVPSVDGFAFVDQHGGRIAYLEPGKNNSIVGPLEKFNINVDVSYCVHAPVESVRVSIDETNSLRRPGSRCEKTAPYSVMGDLSKLDNQVQTIPLGRHNLTATAYTGAAIDGAKVRWRVVRQVRYPVWWYWRCWWMPPRPQQSQEIAHGSATTGTDGKFACQAH